MKKYIFMVMMTILCLPEVMAQSVYKTSGFCGEDCMWTFDGYTLVISNVSKKSAKVTIDNYDVASRIAPWVKKKLDVRKVSIGIGITRIGSCAFAFCQSLQEVVFEGTDVKEIGWGAFMNCSRLRNISLPIQLSVIETTSVIGHHVFASEVNMNNRVRHSLYGGEIVKLPSYINPDNSHEFGLAKSAVEKVVKGREMENDYDYLTSDVDSLIPTSFLTRNDTYALIIGNQNYRFASDVPYAIHDARVFGEYCKQTLGIPAGNIHIVEDATKQMILEEEFEDWVKTIPNREEKKLIVYYAGHGVPDVKNKNKAYILPTDVRGTNVKRGIALDDFYAMLGDLQFNQTSVFLDACFSGVNRTNEGVAEGLRAVEIDAEEATLGGGSLIVFSAAKGNETAQGYPEQGHGLFTYYLLKSLQDSFGDITFGDLSDKIATNVSTRSKEMKMHKNQTPATNASEKIADAWRNLKF